MTMMKAVCIHRFGGPEVMDIEEVPVPQPQADELLVRVHAASVNPIDYKIRRGVGGADKLPLTLGRDASGVVESAGSRVERVKPGDAIYAMLGPDRCAFAEYVVVKTGEGAPKPSRLRHITAAAVSHARLIAWYGLLYPGLLQSRFSPHIQWRYNVG